LDGCAPPAGDAGGGHRRDGRLRGGREGAGKSHLPALHRPEARGVGRLPSPGHTLGAGSLPGGDVTQPANSGVSVPDSLPTPRGAHLEMVAAVLAGEGLERTAEIASPHAGAAAPIAV